MLFNCAAICLYIISDFACTVEYNHLMVTVSMTVIICYGIKSYLTYFYVFIIFMSLREPWEWVLAPVLLAVLIERASLTFILGRQCVSVSHWLWWCEGCRVSVRPGARPSSLDIHSNNMLPSIGYETLQFFSVSVIFWSFVQSFNCIYISCHSAYLPPRNKYIILLDIRKNP